MKIIAVLLISLALLGCAALVTNSPTQRAAAAYTALSLTNDTAFILTNGGTISREHAAATLEKTRAARRAVDAVRTFDDLDAAFQLIYAAQDLLCEKTPQDANCMYLKSTRSTTP
jgi:hypothetical protein